MATVSKWTPFGVALNLTATGGTVTRISATNYTVKINASWETYWDGAQTNYGMSAASGGVTKVISSFGTKRSSGSASFTGTYSISGNGSASKTITVTFKNYEEDWQGNVTESATKTVSFTVTVPDWTSYKVSYNANGGSGAPSSQTKWKDQTLTLSSTKPARSGWTFMGWGTSASDTSANYSAGGSYTSNAAITLYAVWRKQLTLSYNANGGSGAPSNSSAYIYNATTGKAFTISSTKPTRTGYTFLGWSTSASATSATYSSGGSITLSANVTLYAVWSINTYSLTINPNGGTWNGVSSNIVIKLNYQQTYTIKDPVWTGHTFSGWTLSGSGSLSGSVYTFGAGAGVITAKWDTNSYDVVFNAGANGGTVSGVEVTTRTVEYGATFAELPTATKKNYKFLGWYTAPSGGEQITSPYTVTGNITLYAQFEIDSSAYVNDEDAWKTGVTFVTDTDGTVKKGHAKVNDNGVWKDGYCK